MMTVRNHQRPDLATMIEHSMRKAGILESHVELAGTEAYLRGLAPSYEAKRRAGERAQAALPGARIVNEVRVACGGADSDRHLVRAARQALRARLGEQAETLGITALGGIVTLQGRVRDADERQAAEAAVWDACRVVRVLNHLRTEAEASSAQVAHELTQYVCDATNIERWRITVDFNDDGVARVRGEVLYPWQRDAVEELLRWHRLVRDVRNELSMRQAV